MPSALVRSKLKQGMRWRVPLANCIAKRRMARTTIVVGSTGRYANETADELRLKMVIVEPEQTGAAEKAAELAP